MKGTSIYSAIRSLNTGDHSRTLHELHQELRNVTRLGLKAYKNLLAMSLKTKHWAVTDTPSDMVEDNWTEEEIILMVQNTQEDREDAERTLAAEVIRHRRASRSHSKVLAEMNIKYLEMLDIAIGLKEIIEGTGRVGGIGNLHFNMLQVP